MNFHPRGQQRGRGRHPPPEHRTSPPLLRILPYPAHCSASENFTFLLKVERKKYKNVPYNLLLFRQTCTDISGFDVGPGGVGFWEAPSPAAVPEI